MRKTAFRRQPNRQELHHLVDEIPDHELLAAERYLMYLRLVGQDPLLHSLLSAPLDDEPLTEEDRAALDEARDDVVAGRLVSHDEARRRLLGRP